MILGIIIGIIIGVVVLTLLVQFGILNLKAKDHSAIKQVCQNIKGDFDVVESSFKDGFQKGKNGFDLAGSRKKDENKR